MPRPQPTPLRSASPSRQASGSSSRPAQKQRWKVRSAGVNPMSMPCRTATKPAAQNSAAPTPQAMPSNVERLRIDDFIRTLRCHDGLDPPAAVAAGKTSGDALRRAKARPSRSGWRSARPTITGTSPVMTAEVVQRVAKQWRCPIRRHVAHASTAAQGVAGRIGLSHPGRDCLSFGHTQVQGVKPWPRVQEIQQGHHHLRRHRLDPHAVDVAASAGHRPGDRRRRGRRGRGRRRGRASACAQSEGRPARPDARGVRAVPQGDQAALSNVVVNITTGGAPTMSIEERVKPGRDLQAGGRLAQHGHDELRALSDDPALQGQVQTRLGGAVSGGLEEGHVQEHLRRHRIHPHHLRREQHPLRDRVLRHRPSLHAAPLPRPRRGQAAAVRAVGVRHPRRHRRASRGRHA